MNITPKLSIIVPVYNGEMYIGRCLDSLINQSLKNIEIIVVDDGSTDNTVTCALSYKKVFPTLSVCTHNHNLGTGTARNTGISLAKGEYLAFLDADDWMDTNAYIEMIKALDDSHADVAVCGIKTEYSDTILSTIRYQYSHRNQISARFALKLLCKSETQDAFISPMVGNKIFRLDYLKSRKLMFPNQSLFEDDEFMFLALLYANSVILVPNVYQHYFQRESSAMHFFSVQYIDCLIKTFDNIRCHLSNERLFSTYEVEYYSFLDRSLKSLLDTLFSCEQHASVHRKHIIYLLERLLQTFSIQELLSHIEPCRLYRIWLRS